MKAIDVSKWQGSIDWAKVKASGIENVFLRASVWLSEDERFHTNAKGAYAAGLNVGAYHYSCAVNVAEALREADFFLQTIAPYKLALPVAFDFEDPTRHTPLSKTQCTEIVQAFCGRLEEAKYYSTLYAFASWMSSKFDLEELARFDKWVAHWDVKQPDFSGKYGAWQYSNKGHVDGISGDVDFNELYKDYPAIIKAAGLNGWGADYKALYESEQAMRIAAEAERDAYRSRALKAEATIVQIKEVLASAGSC